MGKRRRRRSTGKSELLRTPSAPVERLDGMAVPNHLMSLAAPGEDFEVFKEHRFPRVRMMKSDAGCAESTGLVFVDERYGLSHFKERDSKSPATWMDPEIYLLMALNDEQAVRATQSVVRQKDKRAIKRVEPELDRILEEQYLPYLFEQFAVARKYLAEWLVAHVADDVENMSDKEKREFAKAKTA
jgi:hypothetical protein